MTAYIESPAGIVFPRSSNGHGPNGTAAAALQAELLEASVAELQARLQEDSWLRLDGDGAEFGREAVGAVVASARAHYLKNPLVNRAVEIGALYVWGQDLSVSVPRPEGLGPDDPNPVQTVVDRFWQRNRGVLTGQHASRQLEVELQVTGNLFLALFPDPVTGDVPVRHVPIEEVREIVANPEDRAEVWYYKREWREKAPDGKLGETKRAYHPDWRYRPAALPESFGGLPVIRTAPLLHVRVGAFPHWRWGVPEVYAALDWARAYKDLLEDDATRSRALARFAWKVSTKGGAAGVAAVKARLGTTFGTGGSGTETNPPPVPGSTAIVNDGTNIDPIKIAGATLNPDHSRPARLMAAAALGVPDHFFDADVGNFATSKTLDRPTELRFAERRQLWVDLLTDLIGWAIDRDLEASRGLLPKALPEDARAVSLSFPDLLERSVTERVQAVIDAATMLGRTPAGTIATETVSRLLLVALGVDDVDGELEKADEEREERSAMAAQIAQRTGPPDGDEDEEREAFVAEVRRFREDLRAVAR
jgi:hypothetical protein